MVIDRVFRWCSSSRFRKTTHSARYARAEKFISEIQLTGRTEAITGDLQYIGVTDPKKHREDLLKKIAEDARNMQTIFGSASTGATAISLTGLEGRVKTRRSGPLEMEIYIPYSIILGSPLR